MHARDTESNKLDGGTDRNFLGDSIRGLVWQLGITLALVATTQYASKLVSDLIFRWY